MFLRKFFLLIFFLNYFLNANSNLKEILEKIIPFRADGKMEIATSIKHVKLDIGLSYCAPISQYWLKHENDLFVFAFEPNPSSISSILSGKYLDKSLIGKNFFLIPCALNLNSNSMMKFYVTSHDCGTSSLYQPLYLAVEKIIDVPVFSLKDFFDLFPFDIHPVIEHIKIDAQGSDLNIAKSAQNYLQEKVIYITLEAENYHYKDTINSEKDIDNYMTGIGFIRYTSSQVYDPTYFNPKFTDYVKNNRIEVSQTDKGVNV